MDKYLPIYDEAEIRADYSWETADRKMLPQCAVPCGQLLRVSLALPRAAAAEYARISLCCDDGGEIIEYKLCFDSCRKEYDVFAASVTFSDDSLFYCTVTYFACGKEHTVRNTLEDCDDFQLTVYHDDFNTPDWYAGGVMYQIFTDRFARSTEHEIKAKKGTYIVENYQNAIPKYPEKPGDEVDQNDFFGGSLWGIAEKLDYLRSLGVNCIYLNPIFEAHTNHKYDIGDYMTVDNMFGGDEALDYLIEECEKHGIKLILDGVFNHTGSDSRYFNKDSTYPTKGAYHSKRSPYFGWYTFGKYPDEYASWWGVKILPTVNKNSPSYREFINGENGVIRKYLRRGIGGWRLDVADELPDDFLRELRDAAKAEKSDSVIIGEVWEDASNKISYGVRRRYLRGSELDGVMNYPLRNAIVDFIRFGDAKTISLAAQILYSHYPREVSDTMMNILGTHDTVRILNVLGTDEHEGLSNADYSVHTLTNEERSLGISRLRLAYLVCATLPGIPCIYYGDEAGLEGWQDPFCRRFFPWGNEDGTLTEFYRTIGKIRTEHSEFSHGYFEVIHDYDGVFIYRRDNITIAANAGSKPFMLNFSESKTNLLDGTVYSDEYCVNPCSGCILT